MWKSRKLCQWLPYMVKSQRKWIMHIISLLLLTHHILLQRSVYSFPIWSCDCTISNAFWMQMQTQLHCNCVLHALSFPSNRMQNEFLFQTIEKNSTQSTLLCALNKWWNVKPGNRSDCNLEALKCTHTQCGNRLMFMCATASLNVYWYWYLNRGIHIFNRIFNMQLKIEDYCFWRQKKNRPAFTMCHLLCSTMIKSRHKRWSFQIFLHLIV